MAFRGNEGDFISLDEGGNMTGNYRAQNPGETIAHFFGKDKLQELLDQQGAVGIRMYYGIDNDGKKQLVLVAADADQNDMTELVLDLSHPCPNWCSSPNPLNS